MPNGSRLLPLDRSTTYHPNTTPLLDRGHLATSLSIFLRQQRTRIDLRYQFRFFIHRGVATNFPKGEHHMAKSWLVIGALTAAPLLSIGALARGDHGPHTRTLITYPTMTTQATVTPPGLRSGHRISK